jgi:alpha-galactosidase
VSVNITNPLKLPERDYYSVNRTLVQFGHQQQCSIKRIIDFILFDCIVLNATFNNISAISWRSGLVVGEAGVLGESHRPWTSNW